MTYGKDIGKKFYEDGSVRRYPGNTCVADITPDCPAYEVMSRLRKTVAESSFADHYILLPEDSYHMTVLRGLNDQVRKAPYWPECLPEDTPMTKVDDHVAAAVEGAGIPGKIRMKFDQIHFNASCVIVKLKCADAEQEKILRDFRDRAAAKIGVFFPKHEEYVFHISLAYTRIVPEGETAKLVEKTKEEIDAILRDFPPFLISEPYMAFFDDMYAFSPNRVKRD